MITDAQKLKIINYCDDKYTSYKNNRGDILLLAIEKINRADDTRVVDIDGEHQTVFAYVNDDHFEQFSYADSPLVEGIEAAVLYALEM